MFTRFIVIVFLGTGLAACTQDDPVELPPLTTSPTPSSTGTTVTPSPIPTPSATSTLLPFFETTERQQEYLLRLEAIEPALISDDRRALVIGRAVCDTDRRLDGEALTSYVMAQWQAAKVALTQTQADQVVSVTRELC